MASTFDRFLGLIASGAGLPAASISGDTLDFTGYIVTGLTATTSLQDAYGYGATITTAANTDIAFTLASGNFVVNGPGSVDFGGAGTDLTSFTVTTGTATLTSSGVFDIDAAGALSLNSSGAAINIGNDAVAQAINLGTGAAARTITIGNTSGATQLVANTGTGGVDVNSGGTLALDGVDTTNLTMTANSASNKTVTIQAVNSGAGRGDVLVQADDRIGITSGTTTTITVQDNTTSAFVVKGDVAILSIDTTNSSEVVHVDGFIDLAKTNGSGALVQTATAGEALAIGDVVTISGTAGKIFKSDANSATVSLRNCAGICTVAAAGDASVTRYAVNGVATCSFDGNVTTADIGKFAYLSTTAAQATLTPPTSAGSRQFKIGIVAGATGTASAQVLVQPQFIIDNP